MLKRIALLAALAFLLVPACIEKPDPPVPDDPIPDEPETPEVPVEPEKPKDKEVTLMAEFSEEFSERDSEFFDFSRRSSGDDFRFYPGFPSLSESGNTILMLRLDPKDASGTGSVITSKNYTFYGSYSVRLRIPDISSVQAKLGACVDFALCDDDEVYGVDEISISLRLADRQGVYAAYSHTDADGGNPVSVNNAIVPELSGFNAASKYYIYGIDWSSDKISWWFKSKPSDEKTILAETADNVPSQPLRLQLRFYHSDRHPARDNDAATQAPYYPYELEADWIKYTPSEQ